MVSEGKVELGTTTRTNTKLSVDVHGQAQRWHDSWCLFTLYLTAFFTGTYSFRPSGPRTEHWSLALPSPLPRLLPRLWWEGEEALRSN